MRCRICLFRIWRVSIWLFCILRGCILIICNVICVVMFSGSLNVLGLIVVVWKCRWLIFMIILWFMLIILLLVCLISYVIKKWLCFMLLIMVSWLMNVNICMVCCVIWCCWNNFVFWCWYGCWINILLVCNMCRCLFIWNSRWRLKCCVVMWSYMIW